MENKYKGYSHVVIHSTPDYGDGYEVIETLSQQVLEQVNESVGFSPRGDHGYSPETIDGRKHYVLTNTVFVLGLKEDSYVKKLSDEIETHKRNTQEKHTQCLETKKQLDNLTREGNELVNRLRRAEEEAQNANKKRQEAVELARTMETDIAKFKTAIGEIKFNEIFGIKY